MTTPGVGSATPGVILSPKRDQLLDGDAGDMRRIDGYRHAEVLDLNLFESGLLDGCPCFPIQRAAIPGGSPQRLNYPLYEAQP